jgi:hypothetical protein
MQCAPLVAVLLDTLTRLKTEIHMAMEEATMAVDGTGGTLILVLRVTQTLVSSLRNRSDQKVILTRVKAALS